MRAKTIIAVLGTVMTCLALPADAQVRARPSWNACYRLALQRGVNVFERNPFRRSEPNAYGQFMRACRAGRVPFNTPPPRALR
jgi:hypothetical protein